MVEDLLKLIDEVKAHGTASTYTVIGTKETIDLIKNTAWLPNNINFVSYPSVEAENIYVIPNPSDKPVKICYLN